MKIRILKQIVPLIITSFSILLFNCQKSSDISPTSIIDDSLVNVNVRLLGVNLEEGKLNGASKNSLKNIEYKIDQIKLANTGTVLKTANEGMGYLVIAFHDETKGYAYAGEAFFIAGYESQTEFKLKKGEKYIFYALSYNQLEEFNSTLGNSVPYRKFINMNDLPNTYIDGIRVMQGSNMLRVKPNDLSEFYSARIDDVPVLSDNNSLNIVLKQRHASLKIDFDYSEIIPESTLTAENCTPTSPYVIYNETMGFSLMDESIVFMGANESQQSIGSWESSESEANFFLAVPELVTDLVFNGIEINGIPTNKTLVVKNVHLKSGVKHNLKIKLKSSLSFDPNLTVEYIDAGTHDETITLPSF